MSDSIEQPAPFVPSPLNRHEITAVVGAVMVIVGVFCPALTYGSTQSFIAIGNTVVTVLLGLAGATAWSIAMRRPASVMWIGVLSVLIVAAFGIAVWIDEICRPVKTFFGTRQSEIRPAAWLLTGIGAIVVTMAGYRARTSADSPSKPAATNQWSVIAGVMLATLGCLFGIAMTNPFGPMAQGPLRQIGRSWEDSLNVARWLLVAGATFGVILSAQVPRLADQVLRAITGVTWWLVGNALFILMSVEVTASLYLAVVWNIACVGMMFWKTNPQRSWTRVERLVFRLPHLTVGLVLLVMGEFGDLIYAAGPPVVATAAGWIICHRAKWADEATYATMLLLGLPAAGMVMGGVPNEYLEVSGLSPSEGRVMLLILVGILTWSIFLTFCTTPAAEACDDLDDTSRRASAVETDTDLIT